MTGHFGPASKPTTGCDHKGQFNNGTMAGLGIQYCEGCGQSWMLWKFDDGTFGLIELPRFGEKKWDDVCESTVSELAETLPEVRPGEGQQPVPGELGAQGRAGGLVPGVPAPGESGRDAAPPAEGEAE